MHPESLSSAARVPPGWHISACVMSMNPESLRRQSSGLVRAACPSRSPKRTMGSGGSPLRSVFPASAGKHLRGACLTHYQLSVLKMPTLSTCHLYQPTTLNSSPAHPAAISSNHSFDGPAPHQAPTTIVRKHTESQLATVSAARLMITQPPTDRN
jgi:hypothetical protein